MEVATDACPQVAGAFFKGDWLYFNFRCETPSWSALHINHKEALAIYLAAERWAPLWANRQVVICSDNQAAVAMINKGTTSNTVGIKALHRLFWLSAMFNFRIVTFQANQMGWQMQSLGSILVPISFMHGRCCAICGGLQYHSLGRQTLISHMPHASSLFLSCRVVCST